MQYAIMKQRMITAVTMKLIDCKATNGPVVEWLAGSSITGALQICDEHVSLTITAVCLSGGDDDFDPDGGSDEAYEAPQNCAAFLLRRYERKWLLEQLDDLEDLDLGGAEVLDLRGTSVTDEGVRKLQEAFPKLKIHR